MMFSGDVGRAVN